MYLVLDASSFWSFLFFIVVTGVSVNLSFFMFTSCVQMFFINPTYTEVISWKKVHRRNVSVNFCVPVACTVYLGEFLLLFHDQFGSFIILNTSTVVIASLFSESFVQSEEENLCFVLLRKLLHCTNDCLEDPWSRSDAGLVSTQHKTSCTIIYRLIVLFFYQRAGANRGQTSRERGEAPTHSGAVSSVDVFDSSLTRNSSLLHFQVFFHFRHYNRLRVFVKGPFKWVMMVAMFLNIITMAMEHHDQVRRFSAYSLPLVCCRPHKYINIDIDVKNIVFVSVSFI